MKTKIFIILFIKLFFATAIMAEDSIPNQPRKPWLKRVIADLYEIVKDFDRTDTNYIESQKYNYTVMLQGTHTYERYTLSSRSGQEITFSPSPTIKLGPYVGWRWIFFGYQVDLNHLHHKTRTEFDLSIYSSLIGVDLFYRKTGSEYRIKSAHMGKSSYTRQLEGIPFNGIQVGISGLNIYYILNHRRFSYPAAFSQSTIQRHSAGSPLIGIGYTHHHIKLDHDRLRDIIDQNTNHEVQLDESFNFNEVNYTDFSVSGGYGYNYAFAHNWLFAASLSAAIGYKRAKGESDESMRDIFQFKNFNIDGIGRFGLVYNNMRWYAGASAILHTYNYQKSQFSTNNTFGNFNIYTGYNFGTRHRHHKHKKKK